MDETPDIPTGTPTKAEAVERAARAILNNQGNHWGNSWDRKLAMEDAASALEAADYDALVRERDGLVERLKVSEGEVRTFALYARRHEPSTKDWCVECGDGWATHTPAYCPVAAALSSEEGRT